MLLTLACHFRLTAFESLIGLVTTPGGERPCTVVRVIFLIIAVLTAAIIFDPLLAQDLAPSEFVMLGPFREFEVVVIDVLGDAGLRMTRLTMTWICGWWVSP